MPIQPIWIIETGVYGEALRPLLETLRRLGVIHQLVRQNTPFDLEPDGPPDDGCVVFYGSHPMLQRLRKDRPKWAPGGWCNFDQLACSVYYRHLGVHLLNRRHTLVTGVDAIREQEPLYQAYAIDNRVFVRPDGVEKIIAGRCVAKPDFATALAPTRYNPETRVLVASPQSISREWRLVIAGDEVVASSQYRLNGSTCIAAGCPGELTRFVARILAEIDWRPDPVFVLDVCESQQEWLLLELNSFSCSGLYACDPVAVIHAVNSMAIREWEQRAAAHPKV